MHSNEAYLAQVGLGDGDEAYARCLIIMETYGENRWWLSDQASTRAYYQTHEIHTSGVLLLPDIICYQLDLLALLKRPVLSHEFATDELFEEVERAWQELTAIPAEPPESEEAAAELPTRPVSDSHKGLSRVKRPKTGVWPMSVLAGKQAQPQSDPTPPSPRRVLRREGGRDQQEPHLPQGAMRVPLPIGSFADLSAGVMTPRFQVGLNTALIRAGAVLWTTQREEEEPRPFPPLEQWDGEPRPLHEMSTPPLDLDARIFLVAHGCTVTETHDGGHITFPEGSTRTELYPRTYEGHFRLHLPDGAELLEVRPRLRDPGRSYLLFPAPESEPRIVRRGITLRAPVGVPTAPGSPMQPSCGGNGRTQGDAPTPGVFLDKQEES